MNLLLNYHQLGKDRAWGVERRALSERT